jgi:putative phosphoesterase
MKLAFISDIHSNIEALEKSIKKIEEFSVDKIYCLGDIVGYGNNPNEVIALLKLKNIECISGNHDKLFIDGSMSEKYNFPYTRSVITSDSIQFLESLKNYIVLKEYNAILSHAVPNSDNIYLYANSDFAILDEIKYQYIFMGHTHYPMLMSYYEKKIINPGSIGQPRDKNIRSSFLICDIEDEHFEFIRV